MDVYSNWTTINCVLKLLYKSWNSCDRYETRKNILLKTIGQSIPIMFLYSILSSFCPDFSYSIANTEPMKQDLSINVYFIIQKSQIPCRHQRRKCPSLTSTSHCNTQLDQLSSIYNRLLGCILFTSCTYL